MTAKDPVATQVGSGTDVAAAGVGSTGVSAATGGSAGDAASTRAALVAATSAVLLPSRAVLVSAWGAA